MLVVFLSEKKNLKLGDKIFEVKNLWDLPDPPLMASRKIVLNLISQKAVWRQFCKKGTFIFTLYFAEKKLWRKFRFCGITVVPVPVDCTLYQTLKVCTSMHNKASEMTIIYLLYVYRLSDVTNVNADLKAYFNFFCCL
jgi:hypothetical protein